MRELADSIASSGSITSHPIVIGCCPPRKQCVYCGPIFSTPLIVFVTCKYPATQKNSLLILSVLGQWLDERAKGCQVEMQLRCSLLPMAVLRALTRRVARNSRQKHAHRDLASDMCRLLIA